LYIFDPRHEKERDIAVLLAPDADEVSLFSLAPKRTLISKVLYAKGGRAELLAFFFRLHSTVSSSSLTPVPFQL
jgi:hypothetical protein